jgi:hypothetical protein
MYTRTRGKTYPISAGQIKAIKMAQRHFGISDDDHHVNLFNRFGVRSTRDLDFYQAGQYIKENEVKGFVLKPSAKPKKQSQPRPASAKASAGRPVVPRYNPKVVSLVTPEEIDKVNAIAKLIPWRSENGLALFLEKRMGIRGGKVRTGADAYLAIEGLKKMFENGMKAAYGPNWWGRAYCDPDISEYIALHKPAEWR